jgi:hypothetical protein
LIPPFTLSALIHTTDPDVGGLQGLASATILISVLVFSLPLMVFAILCLLIWNHAGHIWAILTMFLFAGFAALFITTAGSGATTSLGLAWTFVGSTLLVSIVLGLAFLPAAILAENTPHPLDPIGLGS